MGISIPQTLLPRVPDISPLIDSDHPLPVDYNEMGRFVKRYNLLNSIDRAAAYGEPWDTSALNSADDQTRFDALQRIKSYASPDPETQTRVNHMITGGDGYVHFSHPDFLSQQDKLKGDPFMQTTDPETGVTAPQPSVIDMLAGLGKTAFKDVFTRDPIQTALTGITGGQLHEEGPLGQLADEVQKVPMPGSNPVVSTFLRDMLAGAIRAPQSFALAEPLNAVLGPVIRGVGKATGAIAGAADDMLGNAPSEIATKSLLAIGRKITDASKLPPPRDLASMFTAYPKEFFSPRTTQLFRDADTAIAQRGEEYMKPIMEVGAKATPSEALGAQAIIKRGGILPVPDSVSPGYSGVGDADSVLGPAVAGGITRKPSILSPGALSRALRTSYSDLSPEEAANAITRERFGYSDIPSLSPTAVEGARAIGGPLYEMGKRFGTAAPDEVTRAIQGAPRGSWSKFEDWISQFNRANAPAEIPKVDPGFSIPNPGETTLNPLLKKTGVTDEEALDFIHKNGLERWKEIFGIDAPEDSINPASKLGAYEGRRSYLPNSLPSQSSTIPGSGGVTSAAQERLLPRSTEAPPGISEAYFPRAAATILQENRMLQTYRALRDITQMPEAFSKVPVEGWEKLPNDPLRWGNAAGGYMEPHHFDKFVEMSSRGEPMVAGLEAFKRIKSVWSPKVQIANAITDFISNLGSSRSTGTTEADILKNMPKSMWSALTNAPDYQSLKAKGAFQGIPESINMSRVARELGETAKRSLEAGQTPAADQDALAQKLFKKYSGKIENPSDAVGSLGDILSKTYQFSYNYNRMARIAAEVQAGKPLTEAINIANRVIPNHMEVSPFIRASRSNVLSLASPFLTYPTLMGPVTEKSIEDNPAMIGKIADAVNSYKAAMSQSQNTPELSQSRADALNARIEGMRSGLAGPLARLGSLMETRLPVPSSRGIGQTMSGEPSPMTIPADFLVPGAKGVGLGLLPNTILKSIEIGKKLFGRSNATELTPDDLNQERIRGALSVVPDLLDQVGPFAPGVAGMVSSPTAQKVLGAAGSMALASSNPMVQKMLRGILAAAAGPDSNSGSEVAKQLQYAMYKRDMHTTLPKMVPPGNYSLGSSPRELISQSVFGSGEERDPAKMALEIERMLSGTGPALNAEAQSQGLAGMKSALQGFPGAAKSDIMKIGELMKKRTNVPVAPVGGAIQ